MLGYSPGRENNIQTENKFITVSDEVLKWTESASQTSCKETVQSEESKTTNSPIHTGLVSAFI